MSEKVKAPKIKDDEIKVTCDLSQKKWLTVKEACVYTTFSEDVLLKAKDDNQLAYYVKIRRIFFKREDLDAYMDSFEYHPVSGRIRKSSHKRL